MGKLKRLDIFRGVARDHKSPSTLGALLSLACLGVMVGGLVWGALDLTKLRLTSKLFLQSLGDRLLNVQFEVEFPRLNCTNLVVSQTTTLEEIVSNSTDLPRGGCLISGSYRMQPLRNKLIFMPDMAVVMAELQRNRAGGEGGVGARTAPPLTDLSHVFKKLVIGDSVSGLVDLNEKYPEIIQLKTLEGQGFVGKTAEEGHSMFRYQLKIVSAIVNGRTEYLYRATKNQVAHAKITPSLSLDMDFAMVAVKYQEERRQSLVEFVTYLFGGIGGGLALAKFIGGLVISRLKPPSGDTVMESEMG